MDISEGLSSVQEARRADIPTLGSLAHTQSLRRSPGGLRVALAAQREFLVLGTPAAAPSPNHPCGVTLDYFLLLGLS